MLHFFHLLLTTSILLAGLLAFWVELGCQVSSNTDHYSLLFIQHGEGLSIRQIQFTELTAPRCRGQLSSHYMIFPQKSLSDNCGTYFRFKNRSTECGYGHSLISLGLNWRQRSINWSDSLKIFFRSAFIRSGNEIGAQRWARQTWTWQLQFKFPLFWVV